MKSWVWVVEKVWVRGFLLLEGTWDQVWEESVEENSPMKRAVEDDDGLLVVEVVVVGGKDLV